MARKKLAQWCCGIKFHRKGNAETCCRGGGIWHLITVDITLRVMRAVHLRPAPLLFGAHHAERDVYGNQKLVAQQELAQVEQGILDVLQAFRPIAELGDVPRGNGDLASRGTPR